MSFNAPVPLYSKLLFHFWFLLLEGIEVLPPCPTVTPSKLGECDIFFFFEAGGVV